MKYIISIILSGILVGCGGGSSPPAPIIKPVVQPISVLPSSYENKMLAAAVLGPQTLPSDWMPCGSTRPECGTFVSPAIAFADFMRDGTYSMITHSMEYNNVNPDDKDRKGHIKFYQSINGVWKDNTSKILKPDQTTGCLHAQKAIVADFLKNGMPSVYFSCYGFDGPGGIGEKSRLLLGQSDGTYKNIELPNIEFCVCQSASAADVNGDGYPDIVLTDSYLKNSSLYFLINNKDGTFTLDYNRIPADNIVHKPLFEVELIDFDKDGKYDLVVGGVEQCCGSLQTPVRIFYNKNNNFFANSVDIPSVVGYGMPLDVVYDNGYLYIVRTIDIQGYECYSRYMIQRVKLSTLESITLFESDKNVPVISSIIPYNNQIVGLSLSDKLIVGK